MNPVQPKAREVRRYRGVNRVRTPDIEKAIGTALRALREERGLRQVDIAMRLGITFQAVQRYESGITRISLSTALLFCRSIQTPFERLVLEIGTEPFAD